MFNQELPRILIILFLIKLGYCGVEAQIVPSTQCTVPTYRVFATPLPSFVNVQTNVSGTYYTGFVIDVMYAIARVANFTFTISLGPDTQFGSSLGYTSTSSVCYDGGMGIFTSGGYDIYASALDQVYGYATAIDLTTPLFRSDVQVIYTAKTGLNNSNYFVVRSTAGRDILAQSRDPRIQAINANIQAHLPTSQPLTFADAAALLGQGTWAFFGGTPLIDQIACESDGVIVKDPTVYKRTYASFGVTKGSTAILDKLNLAILQLQGDGTIDNLLYKWFPCSNFACS